LFFESAIKGALIAVLALIASALGPTPVGAQNRAETVRVVWPFETSSLDPAGAGVQRSTWGISSHIYDRLVTYELAPPLNGVQLFRSNKPTGDLAEKWDVSKDGRVYTFHLRGNAVFQDGSPVTAEDVRWSLLRAISLPTTKFVLNVGGLTEEPQLKVIDDKTLGVVSVRRSHMPFRKTRSSTASSSTEA
jgi:peptide/nickel transport system substrate-binding protein